MLSISDLKLKVKCETFLKTKDADDFVFQLGAVFGRATSSELEEFAKGYLDYIEKRSKS